MSLQDWLVVVSVVIIVAILVDGLRRMHQAKKDQLKMSKNMGGEIETSPLDDAYNPELPGGGARVVATSTESIATTDPAEDLGEPLVAERDEEDTFVKEEGQPIDQQTAPANPSNKASQSENKDELILVINLHALPNQTFRGLEIKKLLEACGMTHGDMSIFHRHEQDDPVSPVQFSVANAVEPGYFDPKKMDTLETPGVSFFMSLPGPEDFVHAYECMLGTAQTFAKNLGGELKDEKLSSLSSQTIEQSRTRVAEFALKIATQNN